MSNILKNKEKLCAFTHFLKGKQAVDQLHFCLAVEEFNKEIMNPELSEEAMKSVHDKAERLYDLHLKPDAEHNVHVSSEYVKEIRESRQSSQYPFDKSSHVDFIPF